MNEVVMVPAEELNRLSNYYQGIITESGLLNKAGRLAAEQQLILEDKSIPDSLAVRMVKPMVLQQGRLVKRVRTGTGTAQPAKYEGNEEPEGMADAPIERLVKDIIKKKEPDVIEIDADTTKPTVKKKLKKVAIKKKPYSPRHDKKPNPSSSKSSTSGYKTPKSQIKPSYLSSVTKKALKSLGWKEGDDSPKGGGRGKKKLKKTEGEKLQEGFWEKWRRRLYYASDDLTARVPILRA